MDGRVLPDRYQWQISRREARLMERQKADWNDLATVDPLWAILAEPGKKGRRWDDRAFFATGERFFAERLQPAMTKLSLPRLAGAALDFGCGIGRLTAPICGAFDHCLALDIAPRMVDLARARANRPPNATFALLNLQDVLVLADSSFDFICCYLVLQHHPKPLLERFVDELVRLLRPNGLLVLQLPTGIGWCHRLQVRRRLYRVFRDLGTAPGLLYRLGLYPISMYWRSEAWVHARVGKAGGEVCLVEQEGEGDRENRSILYYVSKGGETSRQ